MSTFQPTISGPMKFGFLGTGNVTHIAKSNSGILHGEFASEILARLPQTLRDVVQEPFTYAPYRDSLNHLIEVVQHISEGECEFDTAVYGKFIGAASVALELLLTRPRVVPLPEIDVRQSGKIEFEWYESPRRIVGFTIDQNRKLVCSALFGEEKIALSKSFDASWPMEIVTLIKRMSA